MLGDHRVAIIPKLFPHAWYPLMTRSICLLLETDRRVHGWLHVGQWGLGWEVRVDFMQEWQKVWPQEVREEGETRVDRQIGHRRWSWREVREEWRARAEAEAEAVAEAEAHGLIEKGGELGGVVVIFNYPKIYWG